MRPAVLKWSVLLIVIGFMAVYGCGSSGGLLEEMNNRVQVSITLVGGEGDAPNDLEAFADDDCDDNETTDDPEPSLAGISGTITIINPEDAPAFQIQQYQVEYIAQQSPLVFGGTDLPPELTSTEILEKTINVPQGSEVSEALDTIMTIDTKVEYWLDGGLATFAQGVYVVRVRLFGEDENDQDVSLTVDTVIRMMDIDNCD